LASVFFIGAELSFRTFVGHRAARSVAEWIIVSPATFKFAGVGCRATECLGVAVRPKLISADLQSVMGYTTIAAFGSTTSVDRKRPGKEKEREG
jgi:hypothetical protein